MRARRMLDNTYRMARLETVFKVYEGGKNNIKKDMEEVLSESGFTSEEILSIKKFIEHRMSEEEFLEYIVGKNTTNYYKLMRHLKIFLLMGEAYEEMGNLNLEISSEYFEVETEGVGVYEMERKASTN